jgi:hypothetical protein
MAKDDEELRLNTLHRFVKYSRALVLEEYSHCEVPAGCGGVVLRWTDPREGRSALLNAWTFGKTTVELDGKLVESSRVTLENGSHTLVVRVTELGTSWATKESGPIRPTPFTIALTSGTGASERDLLQDGGGAWSVSLDGTTFLPPDDLDEAELALLPERGRFGLNEARRAGRRILSVGGPEITQVWVRVTFEVVPP